MKQSPKLELLAEYKGWSIERNKHGIIIASHPELCFFPLIVSSVEAAKIAIDTRVNL